MYVAVSGPPSLSQLSFDARPWGSDNFSCRYHRTPGASITILLSNPRGMVRDCCRTARARLKTALIGNLLPTFENCTCRAYCQAGDWPLRDGGLAELLQGTAHASVGVVCSSIHLPRQFLTYETITCTHTSTNVYSRGVQ